MKVLVTGASGFIGQWVVRELKKRGHKPVLLDHYDRKPKDPVILGDIRDEVAVTEAFSHVDAFIHLAAILGTQETIKNPIPAAYTNVMGGLNILQAAAQYNVPGTYIGVGNHWMNNTYSISKTTVERFIDMYNKYRGTCINIVRAMNAYGPGQRPAPPYGSSNVRKITPSFVCRALCNHDIEIYGSGDQVSDMVYVKDVARALIIATEKAHAGILFDRAVEVGPKENTTVKQTAELVVRLTGSKSKIVHLPMRPGEVSNAVVSADVSSLELVDMEEDHLIKLEPGMLATIDYFKDYLRENRDYGKSTTS